MSSLLFRGKYLWKSQSIFKGRQGKKLCVGDMCKYLLYLTKRIFQQYLLFTILDFWQNPDTVIVKNIKYNSMFINHYFNIQSSKR